MMEDWAKSLSNESPKSEQLPFERHSNYTAIQNSSLPREELVANGVIYPRSIEGSGRFWYEPKILLDIEYRIFDDQNGTNHQAFDNETIAQALRDTGRQHGQEMAGL